MMMKELQEINRHYQRGMRHGRLNVYNPGLLLGKRLLNEYQAGWKEGQRQRFHVSAMKI